GRRRPAAAGGPGAGGRGRGGPLPRGPAVGGGGPFPLPAGRAGRPPPARAEDDPPDPAVEAYLEWAVAVDDAVRGAGLALDESLARRGPTRPGRGPPGGGPCGWGGRHPRDERRAPAGRPRRAPRPAAPPHTCGAR